MDIYETIAELLRERLDQAVQAMELISEAVSAACKTAEEAFGGASEDVRSCQGYGLRRGRNMAWNAF